MTASDPRAGQEAARLLAAAQDWLRTSAPHLAPVSPDGEPCSCPVCRAVSGLREADPDLVGRWVDSAVTALGSLAAQAADLAAKAGGSTGLPDEPESEDLARLDDDGGPEDSDVRVPKADEGDPAPRRVRRVPLDRTGDDPEGQER